MGLRQKALEAWEKWWRVAPTAKSIAIENWIAERLEVECEPIEWAGEWYGEADLGELSLSVMIDDDVSAWLMQRCEKCGHVLIGEQVFDLPTLGAALEKEESACPKCGEPYASH